jgi:NAD(P)-dependent dehydrogenase (short-subunit alcohol dehydrogenase family)
MASSTDSLPIGFSFTKTVHRAPYPEISPSRPELFQVGKTVLITGGHTGIGYAIARAFAQARADRIIIVGRRADLVASAAARLVAQFPEVQALGRVCDVSDLASADTLWEELAKEDIVVDVLVLNAAKLSTQPILDVGRDSVWSEYLLNVRANLDFAERLYKQPNAKGLRKVGSRNSMTGMSKSRLTDPQAIVHLSSAAIHENKLTGGQPSYGASKSAGTMLLQRIAKDVPPEELQIVSYHPGGVFTELGEQAGFKRDDPRWDEGMSAVFYAQKRP